MELLDKYGPVDVGIDASDDKIFPFLKNGIYAHPKSQYRSAMCGQNTSMKSFNFSQLIIF